MLYDLADLFYSVKGEGKYTGEAMSFVRLAGCNLNCEFCDTYYKIQMRQTEEDILAYVHRNASRRVVITGGEPLLQDVGPLCKLLRKEGFLIHLETNGTCPIERENFDWIAVSPKNKNIDKMNLVVADEIKLLYGTDDFFDLVNIVKRLDLAGELLVMPLEVKYAPNNTEFFKKEAYEFCLDYPEFKLCAQVHKLYGFK